MISVYMYAMHQHGIPKVAILRLPNCAEGPVGTTSEPATFKTATKVEYKHLVIDVDEMQCQRI